MRPPPSPSSPFVVAAHGRHILNSCSSTVHVLDLEVLEVASLRPYAWRKPPTGKTERQATLRP
eukprot:1131739-Pyramimonas_sp.AAC.1